MENFCAWCKKTIPEDSELFGVGAKLKPGIDFEESAGKTITLYLVLSGKEIPAFVTTRNSRAKKDGHDIMFMVCSAECGEFLAMAFQKETHHFKDIGLV
jgi:hypothetical protein